MYAMFVTSFNLWLGRILKTMTTTNKKRCFTVMIVPHSEEATYSLRLPLYALQVAAALLVLGIAGLSLLAYGYLTANAEAREAQALRELNRAQQEEINALAVETQRMMEQVKAIDELVELVTDKLDLDPATIENGVKGQSSQDNGGLQSLDDLVYERAYGSRSSTGGVLERASENIALLQAIVPELSDTLDAVEDYVVQAEAKPSLWPARGRISSGFGMRKIPYSTNNYQFHTGVDIIGSYESPIWASAAGKVAFTGYRGSYGNTVVIDHGYGYETLYAHLAGFAVNAGDLVGRGDLIGYMGASGRSTGTHLHYEVQVNGSPVNPYNYMKQQ
jgi:murein DD-endopeptidase MepM/ murein hydrolase activator NlpD